ncbi:MAG TPA: fatty acyl-AMP ligase [Candidatus Baltobacteraceae bacterium]
MSLPSTLIDVVREHAAARPQAPAYTFLDASGEVEGSLTYAELDAQARAVATHLSATGNVVGERVLLVNSRHADFVRGFFGALYAGGIPMPLPSPSNARACEALAPLAQSGRPRFALLSDDARAQFAKSAASQDVLAGVTVVDGSGAPQAREWHAPASSTTSTALLQYTSGSTSAPRGVVISHANLLRNAHTMGTALAIHCESTFVSWLPLFHDFGLIGHVLLSAIFGSHCVLMSPRTFLRNPLHWLRAIDRFGAEYSGAPNFGYDACVQKRDDAAVRGLDISRWRIAMIGAEPVNRETLLRFTDAFAGAGFSARAFHPAYGLAEATLLLTTRGGNVEPRTLELAADALKERQVRHAAGGEAVRTVVCCGRPADDDEIVIVRPSDFERLPELHIGEIWVRSASVGAGYFSEPQATAQTFGAHLREGAGPFLRTGDLGFLESGELYITGRLKDLIVVRGQNHYPTDVERTVEAMVEATNETARPATTACFVLGDQDEERIVIVHEMRPPEDYVARASAIRRAVYEEHALTLDRVVFVRAGGVPKTSSGKVRRAECRTKLSGGELPILYDGRLPV